MGHLVGHLGHSGGLPLGRAWTVLEPLIDALRAELSPAKTVHPPGSIRRFAPLVATLDLMVESDTPAAVLDHVCALPDVSEVVGRGAAEACVVMSHEEVVIRVVRPRVAAAAIVHHTGSAAHVRELRAHAARRSLTLTSSALLDQHGAELRIEAEEDLYRALGLDFIPPELREGADEISAAAERSLPALVTARDLRGDLHLHSTWSDGRDSIEDMVRAARDLGYEYVAITDHSQSSLAARSLRPDDVLRQAEDVARVRDRVPGIAVLHGVEVDIMPDCRLDLPDDILQQLDLVLASLHQAAGQSGAELTERYLAAIEHPLVSVLTHLTNRLVGLRAGYDLDLDRIFQAAAATGTALEVDGAPIHLDLDGSLARRAVAAGVTLTVDSDAHRTEAVRQNMALGIGTARRGWVEADQVLNTRPLAALRAFLDAKRSRV